MNIPFSKVNAFLGKQVVTECNARKLFDYKPEISFTNYVKSQIHCNIVTELYSRDIFDYFNTLRYLDGVIDNVTEEAFKKTLKYYYKDMATLIINCSEQEISYFGLWDRNIPRPDSMEKYIVNIDDALAEFIEAKDNIAPNDSIYYIVLNKIDPSKVVSLKPTRLVLEALLMLYISEIKDDYILEVR